MSPQEVSDYVDAQLAQLQDQNIPLNERLFYGEVVAKLLLKNNFNLEAATLYEEMSALSLQTRYEEAAQAALGIEHINDTQNLRTEPRPSTSLANSPLTTIQIKDDQSRSLILPDNPIGLNLQDRTELLKLLYEEYNVRVFENHQSVGFFDSVLLEQVYAILRLLDLQKVENRFFDLHLTSEDGPNLVWSSNKYFDSNTPRGDGGRYVYFSTNAKDALPLARMKELEEAIIKQGYDWDTVFKVDYTNTFFIQFVEAVATKEEIIHLIESQFHVSLNPMTSIGVKPSDVQPFSKEEALRVLKQLVDLPRPLVEKMALKGIYRFKSGLSVEHEGRQVNCFYQIGTGNVYLGDSAFGLSDGPILHELGHALWENLPRSVKEAYARISWENTNDPGATDLLVLKSPVVDMVTSYAWKNIHEDFAEHVTAYVDNASSMRGGFKYQFLRSRVFENVEYFHVAHEKVRVTVQDGYDRTDYDLPYLRTPKAANLNLRMTGKKANPNHGGQGWRGREVEFQVEISGLYDKGSGVKSVSFEYEYKGPNREKDTLSIVFFSHQLQLIDKKEGKYIGRTWAPIDQAYHAKYHFRRFGILDRSENANNYSKIEDMPSIDFPGAKAPDTKQARPLVHPLTNILSSSSPYSDIVIRSLKQISGLTVYRVTLPTRHEPGLADYQLTWREKGQEQTYVNGSHYDCMESVGWDGVFIKPEGCQVLGLVSQEGDSSTQMDIAFSNKILAERLQLTAVDLNYAEIDQFLSKRYSISVPSREAYSIRLDRQSPANEGIQIDVNRLEISLKKDKTSGNKILVKVPIVNGRDKSFFIHASVIDPRGYLHSINGQYNPQMPKDSLIMETDASGISYVVVEIPLEKNLENGDYFLDGVTLGEFDPKTQALEGQNVSAVSVYNIVQENLLERGIRVTLTVDDLLSE